MARNWVKIQDYFRQESVTLTTGQLQITLTSKQIPQNLTFRLTHFATYAGDAAAWGYLRWQAQMNGIPMIPLDNIRDQMGAISQPVEIEPIDFPPASLFSVKADNLDAISHTAGVIVRGEMGYYE